MDTVAECNQRTSHHDQQTQPVRRAEPKPEQRDEQAGIGGMTNESVGTRLDHGLLGGDGHRRREGGAEHAYRVETERDPRVDEQNAQPEEKGASARDGGGRNLKRHQRAEEDAEGDQANEDRMRSFILAPGASTEAFERPDIHARFHHSPDEKADQQDTQQYRLVSEKRLHALRPFRDARQMQCSSGKYRLRYTYTIYNSRKSIPDVERFAQVLSSRCVRAKV